jgi:hypothetical protein
MTVTEDAAAFVREHREHGQLLGDATEPMENGYQVTISCPCGAVFIRWVTPDDAAIDLAALVRLN